MKPPLITRFFLVFLLSSISIILDNENALAATVNESSGKFMLIKTPDNRKTPDLLLVEKSNGLKSLLKVDSKMINQKFVQNSTASSNAIRPRLSDKDMIDSQHLDLYPYCGSMNFKGNNPSTSARVANSKTPKDVYRWTVLEIRLTYQTHKHYCTGTIITDSHVLTAGHCICDEKYVADTDVKCRPATDNQLSDSNQMTVYGGSDKWSELMKSTEYTWKMDFAYVMNSNMDISDIGIAGLDAKNKKKFFKKNELLNKNNLKTSKIVPLCLGKEGLERDITYKDLIKGAGWGYTYQEAPPASPSGQRKPIFSSCMTSQASPDMWRFQNCNLDKLDPNFECIKKKDPPDYKPGQKKKCEKIFKEAKKIKDKDPLFKTIKEKLSKVDKIYLSDTLNKDEKFDDLKDPEVCYNPKKLSTNGWCYLKDYPEKWEAQSRGETWTREAWGVCSPSCDTKFQQNVMNNKYKTVQELKWKKITPNNNQCANEASWFNPNKLYCMENELPSTKIMIFKKKGKDGIHLDDYLDKKIAAPIENKSYREACSGDSGSGQFISNKVDYKPQNLDLFKFVQVAVETEAWRSKFKHGGKTINVPCGTFSYDMEASKIANTGRQTWKYREYFSTATMAHKSTVTSTLKWIKNTAGI